MIQKSTFEIVRELGEVLHKRPSSKKMEEGYASIFALIDQPWEDIDPEMEDWIIGYEQCMRDIADAIADAWNVNIPEEE